MSGSMADSASESDSSSVADGPTMMPPSACMPPSPITREHWQKRMDSLLQQNRVLKTELETYKLRVKSLQEENRALRQASVNIQARAEQEEEYISNTLLKKIQTLKKEKESLALNYEQEEECLTNDLTRKLTQLRNEKVELEQTLEQEQEALVNKLMRKIKKLETETQSKQNDLEQLRRDKIELENTLEQEQEALVNKLWKRMDKLEAEKRSLQEKLEQPISNPPSPADFKRGDDTAANISSYVHQLRSEIDRMKTQLETTTDMNERNARQFAHEERLIKEENRRLQQRLKEEVERREALCRNLSESESSLDLDSEDHPRLPSDSGVNFRSRTLSSPTPGVFIRCHNCNTLISPSVTGTHPSNPSSSPVSHGQIPCRAPVPSSRPNSAQFVKPSPPMHPSPQGQNGKGADQGSPAPMNLDDMHPPAPPSPMDMDKSN